METDRICHSAAQVPAGGAAGAQRQADACVRAAAQGFDVDRLRHAVDLVKRGCSGQSSRPAYPEGLNLFVRREVFDKLGMKDTGYYTVERFADRTRVAPTERRTSCEKGKELWAWLQKTGRFLDLHTQGQVAWGAVHDENALALGGVSGNAGVFSTAADIAKFGRCTWEAVSTRESGYCLPQPLSLPRATLLPAWATTGGWGGSSRALTHRLAA